VPIHSAGPRLYRSVKFKFLVRGAGSAAGRASNISLNLTPFVDMMTILVTFLLMVFSASGELLQAVKGLELPTAQAHETLQQAPVIIVTKSEITYQGQLVATVDSVMRDDSPTYKIDALFERLDAAAKKIREDVAYGRQAKDLLIVRGRQAEHPAAGRQDLPRRAGDPAGRRIDRRAADQQDRQYRQGRGLR